jgi:hypothetical protein
VVGAAADIGAFESGAGATGIAPAGVPALSAWSATLLLACLALVGLRASRKHRSTAQPQCRDTHSATHF